MAIYTSFCLKAKNMQQLHPILLGEYTSPHKVKNSKQAAYLTCYIHCFIQSSHTRFHSIPETDLETEEGAWSSILFKVIC